MLNFVTHVHCATFLMSRKNDDNALYARMTESGSLYLIRMKAAMNCNYCSQRDD